MLLTSNPSLQLWWIWEKAGEVGMKVLKKVGGGVGKICRKLEGKIGNRGRAMAVLQFTLVTRQLIYCLFICLSPKIICKQQEKKSQSLRLQISSEFISKRHTCFTKLFSYVLNNCLPVMEQQTHNLI